MPASLGLLVILGLRATLVAPGLRVTLAVPDLRATLVHPGPRATLVAPGRPDQQAIKDSKARQEMHP